MDVRNFLWSSFAFVGKLNVSEEGVQSNHPGKGHLFG